MGNRGFTLVLAYIFDAQKLQGQESWRTQNSGKKKSTKITTAAKIITKKPFQKNCFGTINFLKIAKQSLYKADSFACSLANRDKPVASTLQRKCSGGMIFVIITEITKVIVPRNYFVIISARMVTFWVRRPPGGVGFFHAKGRWSKSSCPPSKVCLPWVWKEGTCWDVPDPWGCSKSLCKKSSCAFFVP